MRWLACLTCVVGAHGFAAPIAKHSIAILDSFTVDGGDKGLWKPLQHISKDELRIYDRTPAEEAVQRIGQASAILTSKVVFNDDVVRAYSDRQLSSCVLKCSLHCACLCMHCRCKLATSCSTLG
jgi:hypothetical protein